MKLSRRSALKLSAAPVAAKAVPAAAGVVPVNHILHEGALWPVSQEWHDAYTAPFPHLARLSIRELETRWRDKLYRVADERAQFGGMLDVDERALLAAVAKHRNVRAAIVKLKGRKLREFGFTTYDQLDYVGTRGLRCGCVMEDVYDGPLARKNTAAFFARVEREKKAMGREHTPEELAPLMAEFHRNAPPAFPHHPLFLCREHAPLKGMAHAELQAKVYADHEARVAEA